MGKESTKSSQGKIIQINEEQIKDHPGEMVRGTVEKTLNEMLEQEADQLTGAGRYERTAGRKDTRAGHYQRNLETKAATVVGDGIEETLSYMSFTSEFWRRTGTNNPLEIIMRKIRKGTRAAGNFPDGESALMLVAVRLRHISATKWSTRQYLNMKRTEDMKAEEAVA